MNSKEIWYVSCNIIFQDRPSAARPGEIGPTVKGVNMIIITMLFEQMLTETPKRKRCKTSAVFMPFFVALVSTLAFPMWAEIWATPLHNPYSGFLHLSAATAILTLGFVALRLPLQVESRNRI